MWTGLAGDAGYFFAGGVMKKTDWIPGDVKPVRAGVYERRFDDCLNIGYSKWTGKNWFWRASTPEIAKQQTMRSGHQFIPWRGLASDPKGK